MQHTFIFGALTPTYPTMQAAGLGQCKTCRRLEEVAKPVGVDNCRLRMPLKLAPAVRGTVTGHRLGALGGGG